MHRRIGIALSAALVLLALVAVRGLGPRVRRPTVVPLAMTDNGESDEPESPRWPGDLRREPRRPVPETQKAPDSAPSREAEVRQSRPAPRERDPVLLPTGLLLDAEAEDADYQRWYANLPVEGLIRTSHRIRILLNLAACNHSLLDRPAFAGARALLAEREALEQERGWIQKRLGALAAEPHCGPRPRRPGTSGVSLEELSTEDLLVERWVLNHAFTTERDRAAERCFASGRFSSQILETAERPRPPRGYCWHPDPMEVYSILELEDGRFEHRIVQLSKREFPLVQELHDWYFGLCRESLGRLSQPGMTAGPDAPPPRKR